MFPKIPADLSTLEIKELTALKREIKTVAKTALAELRAEPDAERMAEVRDALAKCDEIDAAVAAKRELAALEALADADDEDEETEEVSDEAADDTEEVETEEETEEPSTEAAAKTPAARKGFGVAPAGEKTPKPKFATPSALVAKEEGAGVKPGDRFESWKQVAELAAHTHSRLSADSGRRFEVASIKANYPAERQLDENPLFNLAKFEQDEITAAMCAPLPPVYELTGANTTRRPVFASLPNFQAPRGGASIYPSPSLADIEVANNKGVGIWTSVEDANTNATKNACQTIPCATPTEYRIYGVYRCLTVKNLLAMTFPELVEAYMNRLHAAHSRLAERTLLEAMGNATTLINAPRLGYGGSVSITTTILNYILLYQELQRWDIEGELEAWLPRWVVLAMQMDQARRRNDSGAPLSIPSEAQIVQQFRDAGVNPHFFIDTPTWATPIPSIQVSNVLGLPPQAIDILIAPRGKFAVMDRGELSIGVTSNGLYRDNTSNNRNEFTMFFENFEGIINTNSLPAHRLRLPACWSGVQVADVLVDCEGNDYAGQQS